MIELLFEKLLFYGIKDGRISFCGDSPNIFLCLPLDGALLWLDLVSKLSLTFDVDKELI